MKTVLIPRENRKDLREIPKRIRDQLRNVPVEYVDDVLREALLLEKPEEFFRKSAPAEVEPPPAVPSAPA
jgi:ATP-dependent Lon protease